MCGLSLRPLCPCRARVRLSDARREMRRRSIRACVAKGLHIWRARHADGAEAQGNGHTDAFYHFPVSTLRKHREHQQARYAQYSTRYMTLGQ